MKDTALYIHIPFCDHKCIYCDFYSIIDYKNQNRFLEVVLKEIEYYSNLYNKDINIISIFFGGGTPSFVPPLYIKAILDTIKKYFLLDKECEITLETNPGTVDLYKLIEFKAAGINRISIGIQSFDERELKFLTRIHDKETAINTVLNSHKAGFENISLDLIFNLPKQTKEILKNNLEIAVGLPIKHISAYSLILEKGTILNKMVLDGKVKLSDEDFDAELYEYTIEYLSGHNFLQYEVSNFALEGYECVHNKAYWEHKNYLGFGPSAHSFMNRKRWWNYSSLNFYLIKMEEQGNAIAGHEVLSDPELLEEYVMLRLRSDGLDIKMLNDRFGSEWNEKNTNYLKILRKDNFIYQSGNVLKLTAKGYAVCDEILTKFNM